MGMEEEQCDVTRSSTQNAEGISMDEKEAWLPITESRHGNVWSCVFHLVTSGIDMQALVIPVAFATLGWAWGMSCLLLGFIWQFYTRWLLIQLHESESGVRYSRFLQLAIVAFGPKLGKWLCLFPVLYLSSGQCTIIVIKAGYNLTLLNQIICSPNSNCSKSLTTTQWILIFVCFAVLLLQHPNFNSLTWVSFLGTITTILFFSVLLIISLVKGRVEDISYDPTYNESSSKLTRSLKAAFALELMALSFRGHNLILEIQGTLPSSSKHPPHRTMWKALTISYILIGVCMFSLAIGGHWLYGNKIAKEGLMITFRNLHKDSTSTMILRLVMVFLIVKQLCAYQVYAMPSLDSLEIRYVMVKNKPCPWWLRSGSRVLFASLNFFLAVAFPFVLSLGHVVGVFTVAMTFVYPCFMWNAIKKPKACEPMFWVNWGLGCLGIFICIVSLISAIWNLSRNGLTPNFFHP